MSQYFSKWLEKVEPSKGDTIPMILVAAEGGGIRGASWTLLSLRALEAQSINFPKNIFAFSGVSGGSVGSCVYLSTINQNVQDHSLKKILGFDHLSKTTGALLFRTPIQKCIPFPIKILDRNYVLENSWESSIREYTNSNKFDKYVNELYNKEVFTLPAIFLNCTVAETGQKAIYSNLAFSQYKSGLDNIIDIHTLTEGKDIKLKSAALLSARFPTAVLKCPVVF